MYEENICAILASKVAWTSLKYPEDFMLKTGEIERQITKFFVFLDLFRLKTAWANLHAQVPVSTCADIKSSQHHGRLGKPVVNTNGSHELIYLNVWIPVNGTVWEPLGGVASLK